MPLVADRFLADEEDGVIDLATGQSVRLTFACRLPRADARARAAVCDPLVVLRHPLLVPLIDYGCLGLDWFEAHASVPPLRVSGGDARRAALHLVRFLRRAGVVMTGDAASRHVRPALEGPSTGWRPLGVVLHWRSAFDSLRTVLECPGPPGVTAITVHGAEGAGLRTARQQIARMARLAGFVVIDSRFGALPEVVSPFRHLCVFDWLPSTSALPSILSLAAATGAHRHVWIRFCRGPMTGSGSLELEPLIMRDLTSTVFVDEELGPTAAEVSRAAATARGLPGAFTTLLSTTRGARGVTGVHETAPTYATETHDSAAATHCPVAATHDPVAEIHDAIADRPGAALRSAGQAGTGRLERAVDAAIAIAGRGRHARAARVLVRCAEGLAARGAVTAAARAWCALGELHLARARPDRAAESFDRARRADPGGVTGVRALIGTGVAHLERGNLSGAEAALRTAILGTESPSADSSAVAQARVHLAQTLLLKRRFDAAEEALGGRSPALLSRIRNAAGDLPGAAIAAAEAVKAADVNHDPAAAAGAHAAAAHVEAALGRYEEARRHADLATRAAKGVRRPELRWRIAGDSASVLARCGVPVNGSRRDRLLRASERLPPLAAARIRAALQRSDEDDRRLRRFVDRSGATLLLPARDQRLDLIDRFQALVDAIHATADEAGALQAIATDLLGASDACAVVIRSARLGRIVAGAGRSWPAEESFTRALLDGGDGLFRDGVAPEAAEPVRAAGSVLGSVAVRWVSGANPPASRVRDLVRVAAAAAVPLLRVIAQPDPGREGESLFPDYLLGRGPAAERVREAIRRAAIAPYPVLIQGESGSGKELVARAIHARSSRRLRRFCAVNCAALTDDLFEAEFFGHARGAFTGAVAERQGLFEEADQGTLFLDEVTELSARAQAKLLRALQEGEVRRVGENMPRRVDARIVAATNRSIEDEVRAARFRADLRFRLDVIRVTIPPLRERAEDVPWLAQRLWSDAAVRLGTRATLSDELIGALARYDWPGNVRELQNAIASIAVHAPRRGRVQASMLPEHIAAAGASSVRGLDEARKEFERRLVRAALARAGGRKGLAAAQLGITRQGLAKLLKRLGIVPREPAADREPEPESRGGRQQ